MRIFDLKIAALALLIVSANGCAHPRKAVPLAKICGVFVRLAADRVRLLVACGRLAAADVFSTLPLTMFDNSEMAGVAIAAQNSAPGTTQRIAGEPPAGADRGLVLRESE